MKQDSQTLEALSRRFLEIQEEERRHLARELHDEFGQVLATITMHLTVARQVAGEVAHSRLDECISLIHQTGEQLRCLMFELRPTFLDTMGLDATLRWLAELHQKRTRSDVRVIGNTSGMPVAPEMAITCFRVAQEALTNVARHTDARNVWIELNRNEDHLELVVRDDGCGFDVAQTQEQAYRRGRLGLIGMKERVEILGGTLLVESQPGRGTQIRASFP